MQKPLVMFVDDEVSFTDSIARTIEETGRYKVIKAYSAKEALSCLSKNKIFFGLGGNRIKLIFIDIKMPEMDGLQLLEKIRQSYGISEIGIAMLTAWEDAEKWDRATSEFVINYIKKPCKAEEVIATIDEFFRGKEPQMILETFEKHIDKMEEFKKNESNTT